MDCNVLKPFGLYNWLFS